MTTSWSARKDKFASELVGTFLLVFIGPASVVVSSIAGLPRWEALGFVGAVFGTTVAAIILLLGRYSGAYVNPAITLAGGLAGILKRESIPEYFAAQVLGGLLAGLALKTVFGSMAPSTLLGSTRLSAGVSPYEGVFIEAAGTFVLAVSALSASSFLQKPVERAVMVGATLFFLIVLIGPFTGASFNPVRSLGPAVFSDYFSNQFVYWAGPLLGGCLAGLIFRVRSPPLSQ